MAIHSVSFLPLSRLNTPGSHPDLSFSFKSPSLFPVSCAFCSLPLSFFLSCRQKPASPHRIAVDIELPLCSSRNVWFCEILLLPSGIILPYRFAVRKDFLDFVCLLALHLVDYYTGVSCNGQTYDKQYGRTSFSDNNSGRKWM